MMQRILAARLRLSVIQICVLLILTVGIVSIIEWRLNLLDQAQALTASFLSKSDLLVSLNVVTPVPTEPPVAPEPPLPVVPDIQNTALNILATRSRLPGPGDLLIGQNEDQEYLQSTLDAIFPDGTDGLSEEEISIKTLRYVSSTLEPKSNSGSATKILREGYALCGGMSDSLRVLLRLAGIPARNVNLYGLTSLGGHTLVEVYYNNQWHLYDPTFGLIFYSEPEYNGAGRIPALDELITGSTKGWYVFKVLDHPWKGYDESARFFGVVRAENEYLTDFYSFPFLDQYQEMFSTTFPVSYDDNQVISFPVIADLTAENTLSIGEVDNDNTDAVSAQTITGLAGKVGMYYLIGTTDRQYLHTWFIKTPSPGFVRITIYSAEDAPPELMLLPLKATHMVTASQEGKTAQFLLRVSDPEASVQFWTSNGIFMVDAIQAEWLGESLDVSQ